MASNLFRQVGPSGHNARSFYEQLRSRDDDNDDIEHRAGLNIDDENLRQRFDELDTDNLGNSRLTAVSAAPGVDPDDPHGRATSPISRWKARDEEIDNDVPASLLVEHNTHERPTKANKSTDRAKRGVPISPQTKPSTSRLAQWEAATNEQPLHGGPSDPMEQTDARPRSLLSGKAPNGAREKALWRWVNTSNIDSFMRDVYDYFEGGGLWCILTSNALWLLETLFVAVLLTFLTQCVDYGKLPGSSALHQVVIPQCTRKMSSFWSLSIWIYSFFFIWKCFQYFFEIRRLSHVREFFIHLLDIPEQDMQTVSWQDIVARIMALRDHNPKTATNIPRKLRRFIGSQSKERLDAHDVANRLMRKENYLIAMINKDVLDLSLPVPFLRDKSLFSRTMEWNLQFCILDMAFNELGQVQQDFLRADRRGVLSQKLRQRFFFAGCLNLFFAPVVLAYVVIVYFFTYYNEYQKDPKLAAARKYTRLAEWKFREFNELPHIFYDRLNMSVPFATRYVDQFPKRMTEDVAKSVAFVSGALAAVLAVLTVFDSELFLGFEITTDRTVLFYLGMFTAIWAVSRGMISEETQVFNPEYAMRSVAEYTHYMPGHWQGQLHSFEVKQEFAQLYKMKLVIFLEEIMGIVTTSLLLLWTLPKCSDQVVDFFREFTIHVDGLGYVCSFAVFDFKKGIGNDEHSAAAQDVREGYYATKHNKMAASYFGFIDNYVTNPKTGIPGHIPLGLRQNFHPPPVFPAMNSPTFAFDMQSSQGGRPETGRSRTRTDAPGGARIIPTAPSPMASVLLDPHHQPRGLGVGARSLHRSRHPAMGVRGDSRIIEEGEEGAGPSRRSATEEELYDYEGDGGLGESAWQTAPGQGLSRDNSAANAEEPETGVLGMMYQLRQTQRNRRGVGGML